MTTPSDFEPLEMWNDGTRIIGQPCANGTGRECLMPLLEEAIQRCLKLSTDPGMGPLCIVEVGSWAGANALEIINWHLDQGKIPPRVYCVDHWRGGKSDCTTVIAQTLGPKNVFRTFCKNLKEHLLTTIFPLVGKSTTWAEVFPYPVAAVFIDASHDYESVKEDLEGWWPHVLPGGLLCGHDYGLFPGVNQAVDEFYETRKTEVLELYVDCLTWWIPKPTLAQMAESDEIKRKDRQQNANAEKEVAS